MRSTAHEQIPRLRADLQWSTHSGRAQWIARDPLTANFFCFNEVERAAALFMNGRAVLADILLQTRRMFPAANIDALWLAGLLARLRAHNLLVPQTRGDAMRIATSVDRIRQKSMLQQLFSPLAVRIPLIDPSWVLNHLRFPASILFSRMMVFFWLFAGAITYFFVLRTLFSNPAAAYSVESVQSDRWLILLLSYLAAKSLHEMGHMLACVHRRTQCNEIGVMLLCMTPCMYCDTTDSWKLPSKWHRAGIAAAGMYVELILATIAAVIWLATRDGILHYVAGSMMIVCSLGTLFINSNPFLKYDGYYIFSDLWGVPNLSDQSRDALRSIGQYVLASRPFTKSHFDAPIAWLAVYAVIASIYRVFILAVILWISWTVLVPLGLGFVSVLLSVSVLVGLLFGQISSFRLFFKELLAAGSIRFFRWLVFFTLCFILVAIVVELPLPSYVRARGVTMYADRIPLFSSQFAELRYAAAEGQLTRQGELILEFDSPESRLALLELHGKRTALEEELQQLNSRSAIDPSVAFQIPSKKEQLQNLAERESLLSQEIESLRHIASCDGYLIRGETLLPKSITAPRDDRVRLSALDAECIHCFCDRSELVGWFTDKKRVAVSALFSEQDVKHLVIGMEAVIQWDAHLTELGYGKISRIARDPIVEVPPQLVGDSMLASQRNELGVFLPEQPHYEVTIDLESAVIPISGAPATVQLATPAKTLWERASDALRKNLKPL